MIQPFFRNSTGIMVGLILFVLPLVTGCREADPSPLEKNTTPRFRTLDSKTTGIDFANRLTPSPEFNMFEYMYFYNGAGVGAADLNNDGLTDLFFAANQAPGKLYVNKGSMAFEDVTSRTGISWDSAWGTGVSVTDINNDGLMDLYLCRASRFKNLRGSNQLWVCTGIKDGIPSYREASKEYGLNFSGLSTQAAFFDYDLDGDLDLFLLNHAPGHVGRFNERGMFLGTYDDVSGDRLYRRDGNRYTDVTRQSGINSSAIGYGLGVAVGDLNLDGWPDLYVGNDFHEDDYLYINDGKGHFVDEVRMRTMHTSQFTMGVDIGDITNDGHPEIVSMDMLPATHNMLKRSLGEDQYDIYQMKLRYGYHPFVTRNNLQLNRRNNLFSEAGLFAGIAATDWSWSCLFMDFDNDGWKDLFVSNGIPKRLNDIDYVAFVTDENMQRKINSHTLSGEDFAFVDRFPEIKLPNYFFSNQRNLQFEDQSQQVLDSKPTFSNGAAYADLDNDGDLDLVVNNIADPALIYENLSADSTRKAVVTLTLKGSPANRHGIGSRVVQFAGDQIRTYDHQPVHGYMSSMFGPMHVGIGGGTVTDSAWLLWPDLRCQRIDLSKAGSQKLQWSDSLPKFDLSRIRNFYPQKAWPAEDLTAASGLGYEHSENAFPEFSREQLIPHMMSTDGPGLAVADVNGDGLEDIFFGSSRDMKSEIWLQQPGGRFVRSQQPALDADSTCEDVDAAWADLNGDGSQDLVVASGGNEFFGTSPFTAPRVYLNNGRGLLTRKTDALSDVFLHAGCIALADVNGDSRADIFVGARSKPFAYGLPTGSYLLINDGTGRFTNSTKAIAPELLELHMVRQARWHDADKDGDSDLLIAAHWQPLMLFENKKGKLVRTDLTKEKGWWNCILPIQDGDTTRYLAGNLGLNNRFSAAGGGPVRMYVADFDGNGQTEQLMTYQLEGKEQLFASKDELQRQMPSLKKRYLFAEAFAKAPLEEVFSRSQLNKSVQWEATQLANAIITPGAAAQPLPTLAQLSMYTDAALINANGDQLPDVVLAGNFYDHSMALGRNDADWGTVLINRGGGRFEVEGIHGALVHGECRRIRSIKLGNRQALVIAKNNGPATLLVFNAP